VSAACFAQLGHRVIGVDLNRDKVEMLEAGRSPIIEAGLDEMIGEGRRACRLHATTDATAAVRGSDISFICVATPSQRSGKLDLSHVKDVSREIGAALKEKKSYHSVVLRSTVLPGTTESVVIPALESVSGLRAGKDFAVCYNPEFIREGSAVADFLQPPHIILGASDSQSLAPLRDLYQGIPGPTITTTIAVAEMLKYASNDYESVKRPPVFPAVLAHIVPVEYRIWNSLGLRARLLHHFDQDFPSFCRIAYLSQEGDAGTAHAILRLQAHMKTETIDRCHHCFLGLKVSKLPGEQDERILVVGVHVLNDFSH
jgi:hypothetical protein